MKNFSSTVYTSRICNYKFANPILTSKYDFYYIVSIAGHFDSTKCSFVFSTIIIKTR